MNQILHGDALDMLRTLPDNSIDSIVTDPPYGLGEIKDLPGLLAAWMRGEDGAAYQSKGFMSKAWDIVPSPILWREALRVLKPGGYLLAFAGTRTWDMMSLSIRLAGFELRDSLDNEVSAFRWLYGSGFPKSLDISKAIDKEAGAEREKVRSIITPHNTAGKGSSNELDERPWLTAARERGYHEHAGPIPATPEAQQWDGWGTALKPAWEPMLMFRKPIAEKTIAANVLKWGTGGINVNGARVATDKPIPAHHSTGRGVAMAGNAAENWGQPYQSGDAGKITQLQGRWPANVLLSHLETCTEDACSDGCAVRELGEQSGDRHASQGGGNRLSGKSIFGTGADGGRSMQYYDTGTAARFFAQFRYVAKASKKERDLGCDDLPIKSASEMVDREAATPGMDSPRAGAGRTSGARNNHPTIKPLALMRYLVRMITPPGGVVLDMFAGSGTTGVAAVQEGFGYCLIERESDYLPIIQARVAHAERDQDMPRTKKAPSIPTEAPEIPTAQPVIPTPEANDKPQAKTKNKATSEKPNGKQRKCDHLHYKPYATKDHPYSYGGKSYHQVTQEEWDAASAFVDLPLRASNGRIYQRCVKCGLKRYKRGFEMVDSDPANTYHPLEIKGEAANLFDVSAYPVQAKKGKRG